VLNSNPKGNFVPITISKDPILLICDCFFATSILINIWKVIRYFKYGATGRIDI